MSLKWFALIFVVVELCHAQQCYIFHCAGGDHTFSVGSVCFTSCWEEQQEFGDYMQPKLKQAKVKGTLLNSILGPGFNFPEDIKTSEGFLVS